MQAVLVVGGETLPGDAAWLGHADLVVAADAGVRWLAGLGVQPTALVGDLDSAPADLVERVVAAGAHLERHPVDKDASDAELALRWAVRAGADRVVILGALGGGRVDHEVANVLLLADPAWAASLDDLRLVRDSVTLRAAHPGRRLALEGSPGDLVTLLPLGRVEGVRTSGLRWDLAGEPLEAGRTRGLSNEVRAVGASVEVSNGALLVVETAGEEA